jgi:porphobilinogen synthase (EC 4.2.1.24)
MVRETVLTTSDLIYPLFAVPGQGIANEVRSMPGVFQLSVDKIVEEAKEVYDLGIPASSCLAFLKIKIRMPREPGTIAALCKRQQRREGSSSRPDYDCGYLPL